MESYAVFSTAFSSFTRTSLHLQSRPTSFSTPFKPAFFPILHAPPQLISTPHRLSVLTQLTKPCKPFKTLSSSEDNIITEPSKYRLQGAKIVPLVLSISTGLIINFVIPKPDELTDQAWQLLSIFVSTISGLVLSPLPVGAWAFLGLTTTILTKTLTFSEAFSAFANEVIWLIVISFFFARGFVKTGLGDRIATYFVKWLGKSTLGLSYGLTLSETLIAPAMPSTTARAGGIFLPIIKSLSLSAGCMPNDPSAKKLGSYLVQSQFQCAGNSSALFLTAAAQNLLCLQLAEELGVVVGDPWVEWFKAASLPAFVSLLAGPYILYILYPPEVTDTPEAPAMAAKKLDLMGSVTSNEWVMIGTMLLAISLWVFGDIIGISSVLTAMIAQLTNLGIVTWMAKYVAVSLTSFSLSWPAAFGVLQATYFLIHYMFASQTGHVGALYPAFLAMHLAAGVPGVLSALALAYNTNLFGALTHYSSGQAAVYFGSKFLLKVAKWAH
nr:dicarboxylate transporter 2.1, chloroplastic-like [Tanacetum cinerariifolium]